MINALLSLFVRDLKLAIRVGGGALMSLIFYITVITIIPFSIGPNLELLSKIGPAMIWIGALLSTLLNLDRMFLSDQQDGSMDLIKMSEIPLEFVVLVKCAAQWTVTSFPLILITPILAIFLNLTPITLGAILLTLLVGTPALTLAGAIGAAILATINRSGILLTILVIPLSIPILIFGISASNASVSEHLNFSTPFLFLSAFTLFILVISPIAAAIALKFSHE